jgi:DNA polymerase delta subunit 1
MLRPHYKKPRPLNESLEIQIIDWVSNDEKVLLDDDDSDDEEENYKKKYKKEFVIRGYGLNQNGNSISIKVNGFKPYFYIKLPEQNWSLDKYKQFLRYIQSNVEDYAKDYILLNECEIEEKKEFYGFTNNKLFKFGKIVFQNLSGMYTYKKALLNNTIIFEKKKIKIQKLMYETKITPLLRFFHIQNIKPVGWIQIDKKKYNNDYSKNTRCNIEIEVNYENIKPLNINKIGRLLVASFDIECTSIDGTFPQADRKGDEIIQIGTSVYEYGSNECLYKHMVTLKKCDDIEDVEVESYNNEKDVIMGWAKFIDKLDPDILTGYNIWGFDEKYIYDRAKTGCGGKYGNFSELFLKKLSRNRNVIPKYNEDGHKLSSSALGDNVLYYYELEGIVQIDLFKVIQKDYNLESYKLDYVSEYFMKNNKVDLSPKQLFENYNIGTSDKIKEIAVYCIKDCVLVNDLMNKLNVITNNVGMGNVCIVPLSYLFTRGQGIKIYSLVVKQCRDEGFLIKELTSDDIDKNGYEGAIVFDPVPGIYFEPVAVMDYASLYPSSMIAENISHDSIVGHKTFHLKKDGTYECVEDKINYEYNDLEDYNYNTIEYDLFQGIGDDKKKIGYKICTFAEHKDGSKSVLPRILQNLLKARKDTRKTMKYKKIITKNGDSFSGLYEEKDENIILKTVEGDTYVIEKSEIDCCNDLYNDFEKAVLDGQQLAYKVTCNSVYGQVGASTSPICYKELAASTTATGRKMVTTARDITLENFKGSKLVYGDTDSIFVNFVDYIKQKYGENLSKKEMLEKTIEVGEEAGALVTKHLKKPQDLEYEKVFYPFIIFSKKRYVGNKYELDPNKFKQTSMGIVLKRRDNAQILKKIYGGIVDTILNKGNIEDAKSYYIDEVQKLLNGIVDIKQLIITKSLRGNYANPTTIAHKVLADRIGERDPGNKPQSNDRIPYCFIDYNCLKCNVCNCKINKDNCKCRTCMKLYCSTHIMKHKDYCKPICRFCKKTNNLKTCNTCSGVYCIKYNSDKTLSDECCYYKHNLRQDKYKNIFHDKCKKLLDTKLIQGDIIENPQYIQENNLLIDYRYYYEKQIKIPVEQIFALTMKKPETLVEHLIRNDSNKKNGNNTITNYFKTLKKKKENQ